jgi:hypothetical protein
MSLFPRFGKVLRKIASKVSARVARAVPQADVATDVNDIAARLDRLDAVQLAELGTALAALWDALNEQFDGIDGFLSAAATEQSAYLTRLREVEVRTAAMRDSPKGHYHYAVALMVRYVTGWMTRSSEADAALSLRVAKLIDQARTRSQRVVLRDGS